MYGVVFLEVDLSLALDHAMGVRVIDVVNVLEEWKNSTPKVTLSSPPKVHHRHRLVASRRLREASAPAF
jgi:hypothetical protein